MKNDYGMALSELLPLNFSSKKFEDGELPSVSLETNNAACHKWVVF